MNDIIIWSCGGVGDQTLAFRLSFILKQLYPNLNIINNCCVRPETAEILSILGYKFNTCQESSLDNIGFVRENEYLIWPDKLFRGLGSFPLKKYCITNFIVKQTRTLLGKWKPENIITINLNSITAGYQYHSIPQLIRNLSLSFPNHIIYVPMLSEWNNIPMDLYYLPDYPKNVIIDNNPKFEKSFEMLCKSEYAITTDNGIMHICHDLGMPYLVLDPQYNRIAFSARWRAFGNYHSIPINSLVEDVIGVIKTQLEIPETQMIECDKIYRQDINFKQELIFKE